MSMFASNCTSELQQLWASLGHQTSETRCPPNPLSLLFLPKAGTGKRNQRLLITCLTLCLDTTKKVSRMYRGSQLNFLKHHAHDVHQVEKRSWNLLSHG